ncbi:glycerophosphodiester phosphodiesterase family protein [Hoyosella sp. YIM 151337]|uniref:glycerophosphodiester phosphodiesterase family protein n=1 Tax=Hoyosella sp. YIM 151337 TaxID=2992742 RepID=UPI00223683E3|nr:glycerophosphodiester phosphodiesterase family protein [Hoyosella sp. YIM 151337]MCW4354651.1 glycerophosphodiester phosphodiesterase family protein [Hoyosella sp. YIM 151337]
MKTALPGRRGDRPEVVAHRGASGERPEHTLAAYELALEQGADGLECDVRLTRDGQLICMHDRRIDRTSSGRGVVSTLTLDALRAHDYGSWHAATAAAQRTSAAYGDPDVANSQVERYAEPAEPHSVLTLRELLALVVDFPAQKTLFIETKHPVRFGGLVEIKLIAELQRFGLADPAHPEAPTVVIMSFAPSAVFRIRRAAPRLPSVLLGENSRYLGVAPSGSGTPTAIGPAIKTLRERPGIVERARKAGRATYCWTVDDPADVELCRGLGVRWLATNYPMRTIAQLEAAERTSATPTGSGK